MCSYVHRMLGTEPRQVLYRWAESQDCHCDSWHFRPLLSMKESLYSPLFPVFWNFDDAPQHESLYRARSSLDSFKVETSYFQNFKNFLLIFPCFLFHFLENLPFVCCFFWISLFISVCSPNFPFFLLYDPKTAIEKILTLQK